MTEIILWIRNHFSWYWAFYLYYKSIQWSNTSNEGPKLISSHFFSAQFVDCWSLFEAFFHLLQNRYKRKWKCFVDPLVWTFKKIIDRLHWLCSKCETNQLQIASTHYMYSPMARCICPQTLSGQQLLLGQNPLLNTIFLFFAQPVKNLIWRMEFSLEHSISDGILECWPLKEFNSFWCIQLLSLPFVLFPQCLLTWEY